MGFFLRTLFLSAVVINYMLLTAIRFVDFILDIDLCLHEWCSQGTGIAVCETKGTEG